MYSKHKDALPVDTVNRIKGIFDELGLSPEIRMLKNANGIYSVYMNDKLNGWHVNGKGTSEEYCMASAYGEAMERLQAYYFYERLDRSEPEEGDRFRIYPDERLMSVSEVKEELPAVYEALEKAYELDIEGSSEYSKADFEAFLLRYFSGSTLALPYYSVTAEKVVYLPEIMISALCGSNGLCAGNTPSEAINQGIAELLERHVKQQIFERGLTPPEIPAEYVRQNMPELYETIASIEAMGPYSIVIKDASLGIGMPVIGALFIDRENQKYHAKFGSSFSMHVAIERCLTELFQGFDIKNPANHSQFMTEWDAANSVNWNSPSNRRKQLRSDTGCVPVSYIAGEPAWEFRPWDETEEYGKSTFDNRTALRFMLDKLRYFSKDIYIRDYSFLGFPAFRIYAPGVSETGLPIGPVRMEFKMLKEATNALGRVPASKLDEAALRGCYRYYTDQGNIFMDPPEEAPIEAIQAVFHYCFDNVDAAIACLRAAAEQYGIKQFACSAMELELQQAGVPMIQRDRTLELFFEGKYIKYAKRAFRKDAEKQRHFYLIDRVIDPMGRKLFAAKSADSMETKRKFHSVMRKRIRENLPEQGRLAELLK